MNVNVPKIYEPLFLPNRAGTFSPERKAEIRARLMRGENVSTKEVGIKIFVLAGGRSSGKTKNDELANIPLLLSKERGDIWYCRSEQGDIRMSIFQSMQSTIQSLGFTLGTEKDDFKVSRSPFEITCNKTGNKIQFLAINKDINRTKGYEPPSGRLKKVILEEANEPDGEIYVEALKSTALRFMDETSKLVFKYNPPPNRRHWANRYYPKLVEEGAVHIRATWKDIAGLLEPSQIADIISFRDTDYRHYAYWYLGEPLDGSGRVIWAFDKTKHLIRLAEIQRRIRRDIFYQPVAMFYGVDSGLKRDATAVSAWALYPDGQLIKLSTMYVKMDDYINNTGERGLANSDQARMVDDWHTEFRRSMADFGIVIPDAVYERWCFDGAAITQDLMLEYEKLGHQCVPITNKDIERDVSRLNNSYRTNKLLILDVEDNKPSIEEMENFMRDEENEIPEGQDDHTVDADKYATYDYYYNYL